MTTVKCHCTYISNSIDCVDIFNSKCTSGKHSTSQGQRHGYYCHGHNTFWHAMATNGFYHSTFQSVLLLITDSGNVRTSSNTLCLHTQTHIQIISHFTVTDTLTNVLECFDLTLLVGLVREMTPTSSPQKGT